MRNAARLLEEFSRTDRELGVSELARRLDLATSTAHRLLATLTAERLLERGNTPGSYRLGLALFDLGANVSPHLDLHEAAMPVMATLRHSTGETVQLAVLDGLESVYIDAGTLRTRLAEVAERGWAENREESRVGVVSVGAPVRAANGTVIAALSVATPTDRAGTAALGRIRRGVVEAATVISRRLGHPG